MQCVLRTLQTRMGPFGQSVGCRLLTRSILARQSDPAYTPPSQLPPLLRLTAFMFGIAQLAPAHERCARAHALL